MAIVLKNKNHVCYACNNVIEYTYEYYKTDLMVSYDAINSKSIKGLLTDKVAFVDNKIVEVDLICPHCHNLNRFKVSTY